MNPFYSHPHSHLAAVSQHLTSNNSPSPPNISSLQTHIQQHQQQIQQQHQHHQQHLHLTTQSQSQLIQPQGQSPAAVAAAAAASFYARSNDNFNNAKRHIQNSQSTIPSTNVQSSSAWKTNLTNNCFMENFKFDPNSNLFGGIEDTILARAEALADITKASHHMSKSDNIYIAANHHMCSMTRHHLNPFETNHASDSAALAAHHHQSAVTAVAISDANNNSFYNALYASNHHPAINQSSHNTMSQHSAAIAAVSAIHHTEIDVDPRELEAFAERFKQRRIKLGVTQADVGQQLSKLKIPGVGSLSQSTICRFESLTLSHNNMIALKPILQSWLEQAEADARMKRKSEEAMSTSSNGTNNSSVSSTSYMGSNNVNIDRKRKRTSIAAPEKRSLEAYFSLQPRPSGEKIAQIAEKLDLKKNVVRVWFCNQRQKQKRMKFASIPENDK